MAGSPTPAPSGAATATDRTPATTADPAADLASGLRLLGVVWRDLARHAVPDGAGAGLSSLASVQRSERGRVSDVAADLRVSLPVASRHLAALEAAGHVARTTDPDDRRAHRVAITPAGTEALERVRRGFAAAMGAVVSDWDDDDVRHLAGLLARLHDDYAHHGDAARDAAAAATQEDR